MDGALSTTPSELKNSTEGKQGVARVWRALRHRNFRLFFAGQSISLIGTWMTRVATSWLIYRLTGSALLLGLVSFAGQIPTFLLAPFAGVLVDRLDRRKMLVWTQALAALQSLALAVLTLTKVINIHEVLWLSVLQGLINAFDMPGRQAFLVQMIEEKQDLGNAIALNSSMVNMARLIGPALAGMVIGVVGEGYCFLTDGVSYLAVIASLLMMRVNVAGGEAFSFFDAAATERRLDLCAQLSTRTNYSAALRFNQPYGNAVHGVDADLCSPSSAGRAAYSGIPAGSLWRGCIDFGGVSGVA